LYRMKAKSIVGLCQALIDRFNGEIPSTRKELELLPGVGRKTANVILNVVFGQPTVAVDTHIFRLANRVGLTYQPSPEKTELALLKRIPKAYLLHAHHYLILHGRYTCTARNPKCGTCPVTDDCQWKEKTL
jgi:endonuclease-3